MNILFYLIRYPGVGGIERATSKISNKMCDDGHKVDILSVTHDDTCAGTTKAIVHSMPNDKVWLSQENYAFADELIKKEHYDAIIYMDSNARIENIICKLSREYKIPLYVFERSSPLYFYKMFKLKPLFSINGIKQRLCLPKVLYQEITRKPKLFRYAAKYVMLSKNYIPEMAKITCSSPKNKKFTFINNAVNYTPITEEAFCKKKNYVLTVCQFMPMKRVNLMLDIWKKMDHHNWKFIIVGDGPLKESLLDKVKEGLIDDVIFTGYADPTNYYIDSKIFLMTSSFEGWPNTLLEAMQNGCVPIAYNSFSALTDIVQDNETGFIIPDKDDKTYIRTLSHLMCNDLDYLRLAHNAIKSVERYDLDIIINDWYNLLGCQKQIHRG